MCNMCKVLPAMLLRIARGDITRWRAGAIATSANASLCGNSSPTYWRFLASDDGGAGNDNTAELRRRTVPYSNVDGAVHAAAGSQNEGGLAVTQPPPTRSPGVSRPQLAQFLQRLLAERGFIYRCGSLVLDVEI